MKFTRILPLAAVMAFCLTGCFLLPAEAEIPTLPLVQTQDAADYVTETVRRGDLALTAEVSLGSVALQEESLSFPVSGERYGSIYVQVGDAVKKGDLLADLFSGTQDDEITSIDESLEGLNIEYDAARKSLELARQMGGDISQYEKNVQGLEDEIYVLGLRRQELEAEKDGRRLYAGIDGTVTYVKSIGSNSTTIGGTAVVTVANREKCIFGAMTEYYGSFPVGGEMEITVGDKEYSAVVTAPEDLGFDKQSAEEKGVYKEKVYLMLTDEDVFFESTSVRGIVNLTLDSREDVLWLPKKAIVTIDGKSMVYIQDESGLRSAMEIETGLEADQGVEIVSGLSEGDEVIIGQKERG